MSADAPVRPLRERLRGKLPELLLEVVSVVFAVLLALGVDEWRDARARRDLAERALAAVAGEIRSNADELRETAPAHAALRERTARTLATLDGEGRVDLAVDYGIPLLTSAAWRTACWSSSTEWARSDSAVPQRLSVS
jgi:hypothetical protein